MFSKIYEILPFIANFDFNPKQEKFREDKFRQLMSMGNDAI